MATSTSKSSIASHLCVQLKSKVLFLWAKGKWILRRARNLPSLSAVVISTYKGRNRGTVLAWLCWDATFISDDLQDATFSLPQSTRCVPRTSWMSWHEGAEGQSCLVRGKGIRVRVLEQKMPGTWPGPQDHSSSTHLDKSQKCAPLSAGGTHNRPSCTSTLTSTGGYPDVLSVQSQDSNPGWWNFGALHRSAPTLTQSFDFILSQLLNQ